VQGARVLYQQATGSAGFRIGIFIGSWIDSAVFYKRDVTFSQGYSKNPG